MAIQKEPGVVESLLAQVGEYAETRATLLKLTAVEKASDFISSAAVPVALYVVVSRTFLLLSIATAFLLGEWLGKYSLGFFIVTIVFSLAGAIVYVQRDKWIRGPAARLIITKVLG